jgi:predicted RNase H-like HicB family nuclease
MHRRKFRSIIVSKTNGGDWKAFLEEDPFCFAFGVSGAEAVGNLVLAQGLYFGVESKCEPSA